MKTKVFLAASFLSTVGDTLLVFAVPAGLGLETGDIRSAVCMWLIPAVAMFLSSFLNKKIQNREAHARRDYGRLLMCIAALEVLIALLAMRMTSKSQTFVLISLFVFFYALAKEGIPRLLYLVSVFRYFVEPRGYSRIAGLSSGLNILASFVGTLLAAALVLHKDWRLSLILDALTFVIFGAAILFVGRDPVAPQELATPLHTTNDSVQSLPLQPQLKSILTVVPLLFGFNALVWNYLPLLSDHFGLMNPSQNILLISLLRLPGMLSAFILPKIVRVVSYEKLVLFIPLAFLSATLGFAASPGTGVLCVLILAHGCLSGLYWPSDFTLRNRLPHVELVGFNVQVLRKLAGFQFVSCLLALVIYTPHQMRFSSIPGILVIGAVISALLTYGFAPKRIQVGAVLALIALFISGCSREDSKPVFVYLPSITRNLELRSDLTYAAMIILNDTSAHLLKVARDLTLESELLKHYEMQEGGKRYVLDLDPNYRSARGEELSAEDVAFTVRYYLVHKAELKGSLSAIVGADSCKAIDCSLPGLKTEGQTRLTVTLTKPDLHFIEHLASPWFIILRKNRPELETLGDCMIPYQTGLALLTGCDAQGLRLKIHGRELLFSDHPSSPDGYLKKSLLTTNPGQETSPTLTIMSAFANPQSPRLSPRQRISILTAIRASASTLAKKVRLQKSNLLTPQWIAVKTPQDLISIQAPKKIECPIHPLRILLDTSLPDLEILSEFFRETLPCKIKFTTTQADRYFKDFANTDIGICWFTPDTLDLNNSFASLDCQLGSSCYFNWHDSLLQKWINQVKNASERGVADKESAIEIERLIFKRGYIAPLVELNWWIAGPDGVKAIHPAGLFQVAAKDFL